MSLDSNNLVISPVVTVKSSRFLDGQVALVSVQTQQNLWGAFLKQIPAGTSFILKHAHTSDHISQSAVNLVLVPVGIKDISEITLLFVHTSVPTEWTDVISGANRFLGLGAKLD